MFCQLKSRIERALTYYRFKPILKGKNTKRYNTNAFDIKHKPPADLKVDSEKFVACLERTAAVVSLDSQQLVEWIPKVMKLHAKKKRKKILNAH